MQVVLSKPQQPIITVDELVKRLIMQARNHILIWISDKGIRVLKRKNRQNSTMPYFYWISPFYSDPEDYILHASSEEDFITWLHNRLKLGDEFHLFQDEFEFIDFIIRRHGRETN